MQNFDLIYDITDQEMAYKVAMWLTMTQKYRMYEIGAGQNYVLESRYVDFVLVFLSQAFFEREVKSWHWTYYFSRDPAGEKRIMIPILISPCFVQGIFQSLEAIDIMNLLDEVARQKVLHGVSVERGKPRKAPDFPG